MKKIAGVRILRVGGGGGVMVVYRIKPHIMKESLIITHQVGDVLWGCTQAPCERIIRFWGTNRRHHLVMRGSFGTPYWQREGWTESSIIKEVGEEGFVGDDVNNQRPMPKGSGSAYIKKNKREHTTMHTSGR